MLLSDDLSILQECTIKLNGECVVYRTSPGNAAANPDDQEQQNRLASIVSRTGKNSNYAARNWQLCFQISKRRPRIRRWFELQTVYYVTSVQRQCCLLWRKFGLDDGRETEIENAAIFSSNSVQSPRKFWESQVSGNKNRGDKAFYFSWELIHQVAHCLSECWFKQYLL